MHTCSEFTAEQLDFELARRQRFPPRLVGVREEWVTVATLRAELDATPDTHPDRRWREWELALAERQAEHFPTRLFYRLVDKD